MKCSFHVAAVALTLIWTTVPAQAGKASGAAEIDRTAVLQQMYDLLTVPSGQRMRATVTDVQELNFSDVADSRYLDWVEFTGQRVKMDKLWSYQDDAPCVGLDIRFELLPITPLALASVNDMTLAEALAYKEKNKEIPSLDGLTGVYGYGVRLSVDGQVWSYRALALEYALRARPLLVEPMVWSLNLIAERLATRALCTGAAAGEQLGDESDATTACTASTATNYGTPPAIQSNAGHNSTTTTYCRGSATFKFVRTCATSCLLTHTASLYSSSCTTDDGYWNSFDDTDTDSATHSCSNSTGAACSADAAFHCVTRHCAFPCSATASVEWNGNGFTWGASDHLNAKLSWTHTPTRCN